MEEIIPLWDERLEAHGLDAVIWQQGDDFGRANTRALTLVFTELIDNENLSDRRFWVRDELRANEDQTNYAMLVVPPSLEERGIERVWVTTSEEPFYRSRIHIKFYGEDEPIRILKRY